MLGLKLNHVSKRGPKCEFWFECWIISKAISNKIASSQQSYLKSLISKMLWKDHVYLGSQKQAQSIEYGTG